MQSRISYPVRTKEAECEITLLFVSTIEIAKIMNKYKNSILKFNPRSYLDISGNIVNKEIKKTIIEKETNEFSLYNNGITILSDETDFKERIGKKGKGQLHIKNPQIINGGQTAYTLSKIYEEYNNNPEIDKIFDGKEVMLKIITFTEDDIEKNKINNKEILNLIEDVSVATNQQSEVVEADRRANDSIQILLQDQLYKRFGYFYERKRGEFYDGLTNNYIDKSKVINRDLFLRLCYSIKGYPKEARRSSDNVIFKKESFDKILNDGDNVNLYFFAYLCYLKLEEIQKKLMNSKNKHGELNYGQGLRYGKYAIVYAVSRLLEENIEVDNISELVDKYVYKTLSIWKDFESSVISKYLNMNYFFSSINATGDTITDINFDGYYKGRTVNEDIKAFFNKLDKSVFDKQEVVNENILLYSL